ETNSTCRCAEATSRSSLACGWRQFRAPSPTSSAASGFGWCPSIAATSVTAQRWRARRRAGKPTSAKPADPSWLILQGRPLLEVPDQTQAQFVHTLIAARGENLAVAEMLVERLQRP